MQISSKTLRASTFRGRTSHDMEQVVALEVKLEGAWRTMEERACNISRMYFDFLLLDVALFL